VDISVCDYKMCYRYMLFGCYKQLIDGGDDVREYGILLLSTGEPLYL